MCKPKFVSFPTENMQIFLYYFYFVLLMVATITASMEYSGKRKYIFDKKDHKTTTTKKGFVSHITNQSYSGPTPLATYTECGGIINASYDATHVIEYKYDQNYDNNEFCIWTIRNTDRQNIVFYKYPSEFPFRSDAIQIYTFTKERYGEPHHSYLMGSVDEPEQVTLTGAVAVLIFSSDSYNVRRGFKVMISTITGSPYGHPYRDQFSTSTGGSFSLQPYYNNMMSTFVITPRSSVSLYINLYTEENRDFVSIFKLEKEPLGRVSAGFFGRLSGLDSSWYKACDENIAFLIIFTSDSDVLEDGVQMLWS